MTCLMDQLVSTPSSHAPPSQTPSCQLSAPQCVASVFIIDDESEGIAQPQQHLGPLATVDMILDIIFNLHISI